MSGKREKLAEDLFDRTLECASEEALEDFYAQFADENNEDIQLPSELDARVRAMFEKERAKERRKKRFKRMRKTAFAALLVLVIGSGCVLSVDAWRVKIWNFVIDYVDENFKVYFEDDEDISGAANLPDIPIPEYITESYLIDEIVSAGAKNTIIFKNGQDDRIYYEVSDSSATEYLEYAQDEKRLINVNGSDGYYIENTGYNLLLWEWNGNVFLIRGTISESELLKIAQSIKV